MTDENGEDKEVAAKLQKTILKVGNDIPQMKFNTAVAAMMEFLNEWERSGGKLSKESAQKFLQILAPFAPFMTEELWHSIFNHTDSIHRSHWPVADEKVLIESSVKVPVQVNGRVRAVITLPVAEATQESAVAAAMREELVKKYVEGKQYRVVYVAKRILNFIVTE